MEEPWLRGPIPGVDPMVAPVLMSFEMAREDLARFTEGLTFAQLWTNWPGIASVGFHLRHIQGSVDRLCRYLEGGQLDERQFVFLAQEADPGPSREDLLAGMDEAFRRCEQVLRGLAAGALLEPRFVGRKQRPTTVIGLAVHIAEHTQRHVGQAILTAKFARQSAATG